MTDEPNEFNVRCWPFKITARGKVALLLSLPLSIVLLAVAYKIVTASF